MKAKYILTVKICRYNENPKKFVLAGWNNSALAFSDMRQAIICAEKLNETIYLQNGEYSKIYRVEYLSQNPRIKEILNVNSADEFFSTFQSFI